MTTSAVTDSSFEADVLKADTPVVVDFWAEWCGPCKAIGPALEEIASEMGDRVKITKVNIDENADLATKYNIRSIPTLLVFKDGEVVSQQMGALPKSKLEDWIKQSV
ncbi:MAG: thioredoxin [Pseudomonadota bacterium]